jgi:hypothetical protein
MGYMKQLSIEIEALGIDPEEVHLGAVQMYQERYENATGKEISVVDAIREMYGKKDKG